MFDGILRIGSIQAPRLSSGCWRGHSIRRRAAAKGSEIKVGIHNDQAEAVKRLAGIASKIRQSSQSEFPAIALEVQIHSAIEITSALIGLSLGVRELNATTENAAGSLTRVITAATAQAAESSRDAKDLAETSAALSGRLNRLTKWIIGAAIISAAAALIQAGGVVYQVVHPSNPQVLVVPLR
jgi:hypothetical protein